MCLHEALHVAEIYLDEIRRQRTHLSNQQYAIEYRLRVNSIWMEGPVLWDLVLEKQFYNYSHSFSFLKK